MSVASFINNVESRHGEIACLANFGAGFENLPSRSMGLKPPVLFGPALSILAVLAARKLHREVVEQGGEALPASSELGEGKPSLFIGNMDFIRPANVSSPIMVKAAFYDDKDFNDTAHVMISNSEGDLLATASVDLFADLSDEELNKVFEIISISDVYGALTMMEKGGLKLPFTSAFSGMTFGNLDRYEHLINPSVLANDQRHDFYEFMTGELLSILHANNHPYGVSGMSGVPNSAAKVIHLGCGDFMSGHAFYGQPNFVKRAKDAEPETPNRG